MPPLISHIRDWIAMRDEDMVVLDGDEFDAAIVGIVTCCGQEDRVLYSTSKIIEVLMERDGMDHEGAVEFFDYNIAGAGMGEKSPAFLETPNDG